MLRQLGSLAVHGERAESLLRSAAVPRGSCDEPATVPPHISIK